MNRYDWQELGKVVLSLVAVAVFFVLAFWANQWWERWRAGVWAEEMHKAGVKTEVPK